MQYRTHVIQSQISGTCTSTQVVCSNAGEVKMGLHTCASVDNIHRKTKMENETYATMVTYSMKEKCLRLCTCRYMYPVCTCISRKYNKTYKRRLLHGIKELQQALGVVDGGVELGTGRNPATVQVLSYQRTPVTVKHTRTQTRIGIVYTHSCDVSVVVQHSTM